ncbi:MAG: type II toxin-antitoxin system HicB family antitoxin [Chloroflexi bacterium]|nr:type II toxin-antitoxin system HicB family antitoxin [Chloroflexota bacterium]
MTRRYTILLIPDPEEGGYVVRVPALPGCHTQGETLNEALDNAREAISLYLEELQARGEAIPEETQPVELATIEV